MSSSPPLASSLKLRVKFTDNLKRDEFQLMSQLNSIVALNIVDVFIARDYAMVTVSSSEEVEALLIPEALQKAKDLKLDIVPSAILKSRKTIFIPRVRHFISNLPVDSILTNINNCNSGRLAATEAAVILGNNFKVGMRKNLRITFASVDQANLARSNGFSIGDFKIEPKSILKEDFIQVPQCYRCFSCSHLLNTCPISEPKCSICAGSHSYRECPTPNDVKCFVCGGPHIAVSTQCPVKKDALKQRKASLNRSGRSNPAPPPHSNPAPPQFNPAPPQPSNTVDPPLPPTRPINAPWNSVFRNQTPLPPNPTSNPPHEPQHPAPTLPHPSPPAPSTPAPSPDHSIYASLWQSIAERLAGSDNLLYIKILNALLEENGHPAFKVPKLVMDLCHPPKTPSKPSPQPNPSQSPKPPIPPKPLIPPTVNPVHQTASVVAEANPASPGPSKEPNNNNQSADEETAEETDSNSDTEISVNDTDSNASLSPISVGSSASVRPKTTVNVLTPPYPSLFPIPSRPFFYPLFIPGYSHNSC